jgi:uncharacterized protein
MSNLLQQLQKDQLQARKDRNELATSLLTVLYSEAVNVGKNDKNRVTNDDEVITVIKKFMKVAESNLEIYTKAGKTDAANTVQEEMKILSNYLPVAPTEVELTTFIHDLVATQNLPKAMSSVGTVMKALKAKYGSSLDGGVASVLIKKVLS